MTFVQVPLKRMVQLNPEVLAETTPGDYAFEYIDIGNVSRATGIVGTETVNFATAPSRARRVVRRGDVLVSTVRTYLRAIVQVDATHDGQVCSTGFAVLRPTTVDAPFLSYALQERGFVDEMVACSTGVSYPAISPEDLVRLSILRPDASTQRAMADFLDRECERVAELVARLADATSLARLAAAAAVDELVVVTDAPRVKVRHLTTLITSGPRGWSDHERDGGTVPFLGIAALHRDSVEVRSAALRWLEPPDNAERARASTQEGDVLVSITAELGTVCVTRASAAGAVISQHVALLRPDLRHVVPDWLAYSLRSTSGKRQLADLGRGGTKQGLSLDDVGAPLMSVPHPTEQRARLVEIGRREGTSAGLVAVAEQTAARLAEYRDALITDAVTGQLDVTAVSDAQMDERMQEAAETATA